MSMNRKMARAMGRKNASQAATDLMGMLSALTPGIQQIEREVSNLAPGLEQAQSEWTRTVEGIRTELAALRKRQEQTRTVTLMLLHDMVTGQLGETPALADLIARADRYDAEYTQILKTEIE